jgi:uncharacterized protein YecE (DUF72 family)
MPQGFTSSIPPVVAATSPDLAVVRFHGHNDAEWESGSVQRRFAYLYSEQELKHVGAHGSKNSLSRRRRRTC